jgi:hypothetical protein
MQPKIQPLQIKLEREKKGNKGKSEGWTRWGRERRRREVRYQKNLYENAQ